MNELSEEDYIITVHLLNKKRKKKERVHVNRQG